MSATFCAVLVYISNYALYSVYIEAIYSLSVSIKAFICSCICVVLEKFWSQEIVLQEIYVILAKLAPQRLKNCKILGSDLC